ncbi:hypothetical protein GXB81_03760 [Paraburkholderia sp. Ac-20336]|uniref:hypothetical protein n=1 Tax=Paraburkholderia sp. Ac-20336 TaxID=2703886 RepID=UPI00197DB295|nr:hypothetical protein [Paraburkholderia sp. Ac-20336]MBN3802172.1 hypothetical protein [Paraburkholderia sp. Ac-20336]
MTQSLKARLLERLMMRRYRAKRACHTKSSTRCLRKHVKHSRFEGKVSEARREQVLYVECRRTFFAWANRHAGMLGAITVVRRTRTSMEVRFGNLNSVLSFFVSVASIGVSVSVDQYRDWLVEFDSAPRWLSGGYVCDLVMPEYVVVYPNRFALWRAEVFDYFQRWFARDLRKATGLIADCSGRTGFMATALYPGKHVLSRDQCICFSIFVSASETTSREGSV